MSTKSDLFAGRYLFHFHTWATDGKLACADYFRFAQANNIGRLIFLEHIRRKPSYDVEAFCAEVRRGSETFGIPAIAGFEAKILPDGSLDIDDAHAREAGVLGLAEHGFREDADTLERALHTAFDRYDWLIQRRGLVWVHPGLWWKKNGRLDSDRARYLSLLCMAQERGLFLEQNLRYGLLPVDAIASVDSSALILGADAHTSQDLDRFTSAAADWAWR